MLAFLYTAWFEFLLSALTLFPLPSSHFPLVAFLISVTLKPCFLAHIEEKKSILVFLYMPWLALMSYLIPLVSCSWHDFFLMARYYSSVYRPPISFVPSPVPDT